MTITFENIVRSNSLINLTPHPINCLVGAEEEEIVLSSSGIVRADVGETVEVFPGIWEEGSFEQPELPEPAEGKFFLVSLAVASAMKQHGIHREDVMVGGTGPKDNPRRHPEKKFVTGIRLIKWANR